MDIQDMILAWDAPTGCVYYNIDRELFNQIK